MMFPHRHKEPARHRIAGMRRLLLTEICCWGLLSRPTLPTLQTELASLPQSVFQQSRPANCSSRTRYKQQEELLQQALPSALPIIGGLFLRPSRLATPEVLPQALRA